MSNLVHDFGVASGSYTSGLYAEVTVDCLGRGTMELLAKS